MLNGKTARRLGKSLLSVGGSWRDARNGRVLTVSAQSGSFAGAKGKRNQEEVRRPGCRGPVGERNVGLINYRGSNLGIRRR